MVLAIEDKNTSKIERFLTWLRSILVLLKEVLLFSKAELKAMTVVQ